MCLLRTRTHACETFDERSVKTLPASIGDLKNLHGLSTEKACITILLLPEFSRRQRIDILLLVLLCKTSDLDAFDNARVERLPESIGKLKQLRTLFIANNNISHFSTPMVALEKLYTLDLSGLQLTTLPESICRSLLIQVFVLCAQSCHCTRLTHHAPFDVVTVCFAVCAN